MTGKRQGGSVLNFIIVAVVLVGLLAAGIYIVRQVTQQNPPSVAVEENEPEPVPTPEEKAQEQPVKELPGGDHSEAVELPQTGPLEAMSAVFAVGILSLAIAYYLRSRQTVASL